MRRLIVFLMMFAAVGLLFGGLVGSSYAAKDPISCDERFDIYDTNNDGMVTQAEYEMTYEEVQYGGNVGRSSTPGWVVFGSLDVDDKGYLTESDFCSG